MTNQNIKFFDNRNNPVEFFMGLEIEDTNHFLLPTMIAPGAYDLERCKAVLKQNPVCEHILIGYMYDPAGNALDMDVSKAFELANGLMADGYKVTLEIRPDQLTDEFVAACPEPDSEFGKLFVILIGSYFPNMDKIGPYTTLKLHSDYNSSNKGVWTIKADDYKEKATFTPFEAYKMDIVVDLKEE